MLGLHPFLECSVFCRPHQNDRPPCLEVSTLERVFENLCFYGNSIFDRFSFDGRQKRIEKVRVFKHKRLCVDEEVFHVFGIVRADILQVV